MCRKFLCLALGVLFMNPGCEGSNSGSTDCDAETCESLDSGPETPDSVGSDVAGTVVTISGHMAT